MKKIVIKYKRAGQICEKAIILSLEEDVTGADAHELAIDAILNDLGVLMYEWVIEESNND